MNVKFKWIGAGCFLLEINGSLTIGCDPCLSPSGTTYDFGFFKSRRIFDPVYRQGDLDKVNLWLITHRHEDHLDSPGLKAINPESLVVSHQNAADLLKDHPHLQLLKWGDEYTFQHSDLRVTVTAMPALHGANFISSLLAGGVNGYWLNIRAGSEEKAVYITGDTVWNGRLSHRLGNRICDVLIPNMGAVRRDHFGGPLTLDVDMLASMTQVLEPLKVLPVHFGCFSHYTDDEQQLRDIHNPRIDVPERGETLYFNI